MVEKYCRRNFPVEDPLGGKGSTGSMDYLVSKTLTLLPFRFQLSKNTHVFPQGVRAVSLSWLFFFLLPRLGLGTGRKSDEKRENERRVTYGTHVVCVTLTYPSLPARRTRNTKGNQQGGRDSQ